MSLSTEAVIGAPHIRFSYSSPDQRWRQRAVIRLIERLTGQPRLERLYRAWTESPFPGENIFSAAMRLLEIELDIEEAALAGIPRHGPVLFVANHPFGVIDGLAMGHIATQARPDTKIMTHSLLCQPQEARDYLLPVDFSGTEDGQRVTMSTRRVVQSWLMDGHAMAIFPGGNVATSQRPFKGPALEAAWHPFIGKLARIPGLNIVPIYFHGQNSRLFHAASHMFYSLRVALLFRESMRRTGSRLKVSIGAPMTAEHFSRFSDRTELMREIRRQTLALGGSEAPDPALEFKWPSHIRWN